MNGHQGRSNADTCSSTPVGGGELTIWNSLERRSGAIISSANGSYTAASKVDEDGGTVVERGFDVVKLFIPKHGQLGIEICGGAEFSSPVKVTAISPDGVAHKSGDLFVGDVILTVNGVDVSSLKQSDAASLLSSSPSLILTIQRSSALNTCCDEHVLPSDERTSKRIEILLELPETNATPSGRNSDGGGRDGDGDNGGFGFVLRGGVHRDPGRCRPLTVSRIIPGSQADKEGTLKPGDRILSIDGVDVTRCRLVHAASLINSRASSPDMADRRVVLLVEYDVIVVKSVIDAVGPVMVEIIKCPGTALNDIVLADVFDDQGLPIIYVESIYEAGTTDRSGTIRVGDRILAVDGVSTSGCSSDRVSSMIQSNTSQRIIFELLPVAAVRKRAPPSITARGAKTSNSGVVNVTSDPAKNDFPANKSPKYDSSAVRPTKTSDIIGRPSTGEVNDPLRDRRACVRQQAAERLDNGELMMSARQITLRTFIDIDNDDDVSDVWFKVASSPMKVDSDIKKLPSTIDTPICTPLQPSSQPETPRSIRKEPQTISFGVEIPTDEGPPGISVAMTTELQGALAAGCKFIISDIVAGGLADSMSILRVGDGLLSINGVSLEDKYLDDVIALLNTTSSLHGNGCCSLALKICRPMKVSQKALDRGQTRDKNSSRGLSSNSSSSSNNSIIGSADDTADPTLRGKINVESNDKKTNNIEDALDSWDHLLPNKHRDEDEIIEVVEVAVKCGGRGVVNTEYDVIRTTSEKDGRIEVDKSNGAIQTIAEYVELWDRLIPADCIEDVCIKRTIGTRTGDRINPPINVEVIPRDTVPHVTPVKDVHCANNSWIAIKDDHDVTISDAEKFTSTVDRWNYPLPGNGVVDLSNDVSSAMKRNLVMTDIESLNFHLREIEEIIMCGNSLMIIEEEDESMDTDFNSPTSGSFEQPVDPFPADGSASASNTVRDVTVPDTRDTGTSRRDLVYGDRIGPTDRNYSSTDVTANKESVQYPPVAGSEKMATSNKVSTAESEDIDDDDDSVSCRTVVEADTVPEMVLKKPFGDKVDSRYSTRPTSTATQSALPLNRKYKHPVATEVTVDTSKLTNFSNISDYQNGSDVAKIDTNQAGGNMPSAAMWAAHRKFWISSSSIGDLSSVNSELSRRDSQLVDWDDFHAGARSVECDFDTEETVEQDMVDDELFDNIFAPTSVELVRVVLQRRLVGSHASGTSQTPPPTPPKSPCLHPALAAMHRGELGRLGGKVTRSRSLTDATARLVIGDNTRNGSNDDQFGFSLSDGLYERGVFVSAVRPGGPAAGTNGLKLYDKIMQVDDVKTADMDCSQVAPLITRYHGARIELVVCRRNARRTRFKSGLSSPWQRVPMRPLLRDSSMPGRQRLGTHVKFYDECYRSTAL